MGCFACVEPLKDTFDMTWLDSGYPLRSPLWGQDLPVWARDSRDSARDHGLWKREMGKERELRHRMTIAARAVAAAAWDYGYRRDE
jgi:hypothetical protein